MPRPCQPCHHDEAPPLPGPLLRSERRRGRRRPRCGQHELSQVADNQAKIAVLWRGRGREFRENPGIRGKIPGIFGTIPGNRGTAVGNFPTVPGRRLTIPCRRQKNPRKEAAVLRNHPAAGGNRGTVPGEFPAVAGKGWKRREKEPGWTGRVCPQRAAGPCGRGPRLWSAVTCHRFCAGDLSPSSVCAAADRRARHRWREL